MASPLRGDPKRSWDSNGEDADLSSSTRQRKCAKKSDAPVDASGRHTNLARRDVRLASLWREGKMCDISIRVEGRTFTAHRLVLAASSDYMSSLILADRFVDSTQDTIEIGEISADSFEIILEWIYTGKCKIELDLVAEVLSAASYLLCGEFLTFIEPFVLGRSNLKMLSSVWKVAIRENISSLSGAIELKMKEFFDEYCHQQDFRTVSPDLLLKLMESDDLSVRSEETVYLSLIRWAREQDEPPPPEKWSQMLSLLRFDRLPLDFIQHYVLVAGGSEGILSLVQGFRESLQGTVLSPTRIYDVKDYMHRHQDLSFDLRENVVDWLVEVHRYYHQEEELASEEVLFLSVSILDRYLSLSTNVPRQKLELIGSAALLIAMYKLAKEDSLSIKVAQQMVSHIKHASYTTQDLFDANKLIRSALRDRIVVPTAFTFLQRFLRMVNAPPLVSSTAEYYMERLLQHKDFLSFRPAILSVACVSLAINNPDALRFCPQLADESKRVPKHSVPQVLLDYTGLKESTVEKCAAFVVETVGAGNTTSESAGQDLVAVTSKYRSLKRVSVFDFCKPELEHLYE